MAATARHADAGRLSHAGGAWATIADDPRAAGTATGSRTRSTPSTTAITAKITHCSRSLAIVSFASL